MSRNDRRLRAPLSGALPLLALACLTAAPAGAQDATTTTTVVTRRGTATATTRVTAPIHVTVNDKTVTFTGPGPVMSDGGAVLVPLRGVFEPLGGDLKWDAKTQVIEGARPGHQFRIRVGSTGALVDGAQKTLTTPPRLIGGTTYVPLRFAGEALGARVAWQPESRTVVISATPADAATDSTTTTTTITTTTNP